jgi:hypothetical protein
MALINTTTTGVLGTTVYGDGSGDLTVQKDGVTVNKVTSAPAFRATNTTTQAFASSTWTKCAFSVETFDTNNNYDNATNYRFTPTVAGYYMITGSLYFSSVNGQTLSAVYKNGSPFTYGVWTYGTGDISTIASCLVYANGTTDYFEMWGYHNGSGSKNLYNDSGGQHSSWQGIWVRA